MEYRKLPHGKEHEKYGVLGLGMGGIGKTPADDFEKGDEYGIGNVKERMELFGRCQREGVGISVMKPFFAGQLLSKEHSPFGFVRKKKIIL